jgi:plastocyanin
MKRTYRTQARLLATVAVAALLLAGCSGDGGTPTPTNANPTTGTDAPAESPDRGTVVTVVATEFALAPSEATFAPGPYTFVLDNQGSMTHDLVVEGPGVEAAASPAGSGQTSEVTVELEAGEYILWCSIGGHRAQGMEVTITVE